MGTQQSYLATPAPRAVSTPAVNGSPVVVVPAKSSQAVVGTTAKSSPAVVGTTTTNPITAPVAAVLGLATTDLQQQRDIYQRWKAAASYDTYRSLMRYRAWLAQTAQPYDERAYQAWKVQYAEQPYNVLYNQYLAWKQQFSPADYLVWLQYLEWKALRKQYVEKQYLQWRQTASYDDFADFMAFQDWYNWCQRNGVKSSVEVADYARVGGGGRGGAGQRGGGGGQRGGGRGGGGGGNRSYPRGRADGRPWYNRDGGDRRLIWDGRGRRGYWDGARIVYVNDNDDYDYYDPYYYTTDDYDYWRRSVSPYDYSAWRRWTVL